MGVVKKGVNGPVLREFFDIAKRALRCALVFFRGRCSDITERVNNETIKYSIFSITYRTTARSTDEFRLMRLNLKRSVERSGACFQRRNSGCSVFTEHWHIKEPVFCLRHGVYACYLSECSVNGFSINGLFCSILTIKQRQLMIDFRVVLA